MKTIFHYAAVLIGMFIALTCQAEDKLYTAHNIWVEQPGRMYVINYKVGTLIPAGTEVADVTIVPNRRRPSITFRLADSTVQHIIFIQKKFHPGLTPDAIKDRMFTTQDLKTLTAGMSKTEKECVRTGEIVVGISKDAVLVAYGYPPTHQTPTLKGPTWMYWRNRFGRREISFDAKDKVSGIR